MISKIRLAAMLAAMTVVMTTAAHSQYDADDGYQGDAAQARQYGYQSGYCDGYNKGRHEGRDNDPNDYQTPDWRQASRGYQDWMGQFGPSRTRIATGIAMVSVPDISA